MSVQFLIDASSINEVTINLFLNQNQEAKLSSETEGLFLGTSYDNLW